jgi:hypothetical protein
VPKDGCSCHPFRIYKDTVNEKAQEVARENSESSSASDIHRRKVARESSESPSASNIHSRRHCCQYPNASFAGRIPGVKLLTKLTPNSGNLDAVPLSPSIEHRRFKGVEASSTNRLRRVSRLGKRCSARLHTTRIGNAPSCSMSHRRASEDNRPGPANWLF